MKEYEEYYYRMAFRRWIKKVDFVLEMRFLTMVHYLKDMYTEERMKEGIEKDEIL